METDFFFFLDTIYYISFGLVILIGPTKDDDLDLSLKVYCLLLLWHSVPSHYNSVISLIRLQSKLL